MAIGDSDAASESEYTDGEESEGEWDHPVHKEEGSAKGKGGGAAAAAYAEGE